VWVEPDGELLTLKAAEAVRRARETPPMLCHARATARRLGCDPFPAFDLLELFAFVRPASFCAPTPHGLAQALGQAKPADNETAAAMLPGLARALLAELAASGGESGRAGVAIAAPSSELRAPASGRLPHPRDPCSAPSSPSSP